MKVALSDERVSGDELLGPEMGRQQAVLDRAEQGGLAAEQEEHGEEAEEMTGHERDRGERHDRDLHDLQPARQNRLVHGVCERSGESGQEDERGHECCAGDRRQRSGVEAEAVPAR